MPVDNIDYELMNAANFHETTDSANYADENDDDVAVADGSDYDDSGDDYTGFEKQMFSAENAAESFLEKELDFDNF